MATRIQRVMNISPKHVHAMIERSDGEAIGALDHDIGCLAWNLRSERARQRAPRGLVQHIGRLLIALLRVPFVERFEGSRSVLDIPQWQYSAWSNLDDLDIRVAANVAAAWCNDKRMAAQLVGTRFLCSFSPPSKMSLVRALLHSRNGSVASEAMIGLSRAAGANRLSRVDRARVSQWMRDIARGSLVRRGDAFVSLRVDAASFLVERDGEEGVRLLCSPKVMNHANASLREALLALTLPLYEDNPPHQDLLKKHLSPDALWAVFDAWKDGSLFRRMHGKIRRTYAEQIAGCVLRLTAFCDPRRTMLEAPLAIKKAEKHSFLRDGAKKAIGHCKNIPSADDVYYAFVENSSQFSKPVREIMHAFLLADYMKRDGFEGYFSDSGEDLKHALAGLERLTLTTPVPLLKEGAAVFGTPKALESRNSRFAASKALTERDYKKLARLGAKFDPHISTIIHAVERAIAADPDPFRPKRRKR